ncbi:MAG: hypothetical protein ABIJ43_01120, partial [Candidatus Beckwithbacteria bacterium]
PLQSVSTPWRFLSLSVFSAAILAGFLVKNIKTHFLKLSVFLVLVILSLYGNRNHLRINEAVNYNQGFFDSYIGVATGWNEHMPIWVKDIPKSFPKSKVEIISGECALSNLITKSNLTSFNANCQKESIVQINTAYFPGWQIFVDDKNITEQVKQTLEISNGMIRFTIKKGKTSVKTTFDNNLLLVLSNRRRYHTDS